MWRLHIMKNTERKDRTSKNVKAVKEEKVKKSSKEDQLMEPKKMERLKAILSDEAQFTVVSEAFKRFCRYSDPSSCNDAINALIAYALGNKYKQTTLENLGIAELPEEALQIIFPELRKYFERKKGSFIPELRKEVEDALCTLRNKAQSSFEKKDNVAISIWIYKKLCYFKEHNCQSEIDRVKYLLHSEEERFFFGGLQQIFMNKDTANQLKPLAGCIANLLDAMTEHSNNSSTHATIADAMGSAGINLQDFPEVNPEPEVEPEATVEEMPEVEPEAETLVAEAIIKGWHDVLDENKNSMIDEINKWKCGAFAFHKHVPGVFEISMTIHFLKE